MGSTQTSSFFSLYLALLFVLNGSLAVYGWAPAVATWYGSPNGAGSDGGACGYGKDVALPPFSSFISAGGPSLFKSGKGCGGCYQVKCTSNPACSGNLVKVVITDECPGCVKESVHFDLSGTAFGALAVSGKADTLRTVGTIQIQYQRVPCNYGGTKLTFRVDAGSNPQYFATLVEYEDGDGDLSGVELKNGPSGAWQTMQESFGAVWKLNSPTPLRGPLSLRLTQSSGSSIVANNVIPVGWRAGQTYTSS